MRLELVDVVSFLRLLGMRNIKEDGQEVNYSCPFPGHKNNDKNPSASMQQGTTIAHCFGCGWSGNAVSFLAELEGVSPLKATQWLREEFGDGFKDPDETLSKEINEILQNYLMHGIGATNYVEERIRILEEEEIKKRAIDWNNFGVANSGANPYLPNRGFTPETLLEFEIGWDEMSQRFSIPIRDEYGNLVGFKGRALPGVEPRYLVLGGAEYGFEPYETAKIVFNLHKTIQHKQHCINSGLVLCEGELNCIAYYQKIGVNVIGISGKYLSEHQTKLIAAHASSVTLFFDETEDAIRAARKLEAYIPVKIIPEHPSDAADLSAKEISSLLGKAVPSILL